MRIGILGYGAVAAVHSKAFHNSGADLRIIFGPDDEKAKAFAENNQIARWTANMESMFEECDGVVVASPSDLHLGQALAALRAGRHCLVELPPCSSAIEARLLWDVARESKVVVRCAHTSRFLEPFALVEEWVQADALGEIVHVTYRRSIPPRKRSWIDDAILHHAAHPLDLLLKWFGKLEPLSCVAHPGIRKAQDAAFTARLENGAPISINISYTSRLPETRLTLNGEDHTVATDGFSYIESDAAEFQWHGDEQDSYESAVERQDRSFLDRLEGNKVGTPWQDTIRLAEILDHFLEIRDSK